MKLFNLLVVLLSSQILLGQNVELDWAKEIGGAGQDVGFAVKVDQLGNVYSTGYFEGTVDFNPGPGTSNLSSNGDKDIYITKFSSNGDFVWAKSIGGTGTDSGIDLSLDDFGQIYCTGYFESTVDFDPGIGITNLTADGNEDVFVLKLDGSGNFVFVKGFGSTGSDLGRSLSIDAFGNIISTGHFEGTVDFNPGTGISNLTSNGNNDMYISKLNSMGDFMWALKIGGSNADFSVSLCSDASGNLYYTGRFAGSMVDFDPGTAVNNLTSDGANSDIFISKLDPTGNLIWAKSFSGSADDEGRSIAVDASGNVYSTGYFADTVDFDPSSGTYDVVSSSGTRDIYLSKLNASGDFVWAKSIGGNGLDYGLSIDLDSNGGLYFTGVFTGTVDFDPGQDTNNLTAVGNRDIYVSKFDLNGNFVWVKGVGGSGQDQGYSIHSDNLGNVYTTGYFSTTVDFDPGTDTTNLVSNGGLDIFILKFSSISTAGLEFSSSSISNSFSIYPNPALSQIMISSFENEIENIRILDATGKVVISMIPESVVDISALQKGVYFVQIQSGEEFFTKRLVKK